jgi:hypothetical protein
MLAKGAAIPAADDSAPPSPGSVRKITHPVKPTTWTRGVITTAVVLVACFGLVLLGVITSKGSGSKRQPSLLVRITLGLPSQL